MTCGTQGRRRRRCFAVRMLASRGAASIATTIIKCTSSGIRWVRARLTARVLSSVIVDPRDARHMYMVTSDGGAFETVDNCGTWRSINKGVEANFLPDPYPEYGQDVHCLCMHQANPDRLYQQNHCGIYRIDRPSDDWIRIGNNMPKEIGDIGFGIVVHPRDPDTAWVFPMDATTVWPRTSPDGRPAVYRTSDAGATWQRQDRGLPREHAWFHGQAAGVLRRRFRPGRTLLRHHQWRSVDES